MLCICQSTLWWPVSPLGPVHLSLNSSISVPQTQQFHLYIYTTLGASPSGSVGKNLCVMREPQEMQFHSLDWEDPLEEGMAAHSSILVWRIP